MSLWEKNTKQKQSLRYFPTMTRIVCVFGFPGMYIYTYIYIYISHIQSYLAYITHEHVDAYKIKKNIVI